MAAWIYNHGESTNGRLFLYRIIATTAGAMGVLLVIIALGSMWNHDPGWFLFSHRAVLKAKDRANLLLVKTSLVTFGWPFAILSLVSSLLWLSLAGCVWGQVPIGGSPTCVDFDHACVRSSRRGHAHHRHAKSYRFFMQEVSRSIAPEDKLYLYGDSFNSDPVIFYRGTPIPPFPRRLEVVGSEMAAGNEFIITTEKEWERIYNLNRALPSPILRSDGTGPEGNARLVLLRGAS
jgi:hypothetical protein